MIRDYFNFHYLVDTHAHINIEEDSEIQLILLEAKSCSIEVIFDIGTDLKTSNASLQISENFTNVKSFVGVDPQVFIPNQDGILCLDESEPNQDFREIERLVKNNNRSIFGIGETGIDNYWINKYNLTSIEKEESLKKQEKLFRKHLELAEVFGLPLSVHSRNAEEHCLEVIKDYNCFGIFHSFTGSYETAKKVLDMGWGLGVNGIITYRNAINLRDVYRKILGKIPQNAGPSWFYDRGVYFETDSPFLSPEPKKQVKNSPKNIPIIYSFMFNLN